MTASKSSSSASLDGFVRNGRARDPGHQILAASGSFCVAETYFFLDERRNPKILPAWWRRPTFAASSPAEDPEVKAPESTRTNPAVLVR